MPEKTERICKYCSKSWLTVARTHICPKCKYKREAPKQRAGAKARKYAAQEASAGRPRPAHCEVCHAIAPTAKAHAWDHNHGTGKFRGWLCQGCNVALGAAGDNPAILRALADYLVSNGCSPKRPLLM